MNLYTSLSYLKYLKSIKEPQPILKQYFMRSQVVHLLQIMILKVGILYTLGIFRNYFD